MASLDRGACETTLSYGRRRFKRNTTDRLACCTLRVHSGVVASTTYRDVLARNVRVARAAKQIGQQELARRMRVLGFGAWLHQTVGNVERGKRRLVAEEILALALALETSVGMLMDPSREDGLIMLPGGQPVMADTVLRSVRHFNDGMVSWDDGTLRLATREPESWPETAIGRQLREEARGLDEFGADPRDFRERSARLHPEPPGGWPEPGPSPEIRREDLE